MNEEFRKFLEQMDAEEEKKSGERPKFATWLKENTADPEVKTYRVNRTKLAIWLATHPLVFLRKCFEIGQVNLLV